MTVTRQLDDVPVRFGEPATSNRASPKPIALTDEQLVNHIARGQVWAFGEIYDRYARLVYSLALKILNDSTSAEDIVQQVFAKVWRNANQYQPMRGKFSSWLVAISHHQLMDELRHRRAFQVSELTDNIPSVEKGPVEYTEHLLEYTRVRDALAQIPVGDRRAIELAYFGGLCYQEIADRYGVSRGAIKSRIHRGMAKLRELLQE